MFKMSIIGTNTSMQPCWPLVNCHQSVSALSLTTHAAEAVAAHECHEHDSDVIFSSHVKLMSR